MLVPKDAYPLPPHFPLRLFYAFQLLLQCMPLYYVLSALSRCQTQKPQNKETRLVAEIEKDKGVGTKHMSENRFGDREQEQQEEESMPPPSPRRGRNRNSRNPFRCSSTAATFLATSFAVAALFLVFSVGPPSSGGHGQRVPANMSDEFRFDVADIPSNRGKRFTAPPGFTFAEAMGRMAEEGDNEFTKAFTTILKYVLALLLLLYRIVAIVFVTTSATCCCCCCYYYCCYCCCCCCCYCCCCCCCCCCF